MSTVQGAVHVPRRTRDELEQLAAEFIQSGLDPKPAVPTLTRAVLAGAAVGIAALAAWLLWPQAGTATVREAPAQVAEAEAWAKRLEVERERKRRDLQSSREYLAKMAATDSALLDEMTARAQALATRAAAEPATAPPARVAEPEPPGEPAQPAPTPARVEAASAEPTPPAAAPAPARQAAPATAPPVEVVQADPASCRIHVSELSSSGRLTYADLARMKGATTDDRGHVFTPEITAANGRRVIFEVMPTGCVRVARTRR